MGSLQLEPSWEVIQFNMNTKAFVLSCLLALSHAAPKADADADPYYLGLGAGHAIAAPVAPLAYHTGPAPNCVTEEIILTTQVCTPTAEQVCSMETIATQEIEYEKICQEIVDTLCDAAPVAAYHHVKREADAEADAEADPFHYAYGGLAAHHAAPLVAPAPL